MDHNNYNDLTPAILTSKPTIETTEMWEWQGEDYCLQTDTNLAITHTLWNGVSQNEDDLSSMFDETTPIKDCGDLGYYVSNCDNMGKELQQCNETLSQAKRRRMLQFDTEVLDAPLCNADMSLTFLKTKEREDLVEDAASDVTRWVSGFTEDTSPSGYEGLDQSSEGWLADCFNYDINLSGASDVQIDMTEFCTTQPENEANVVHKRPTRTHRNVIFKGRKAYVQPPTKLASSVAYPFAFVKPCGVRGDVTLKEINQRILTPPPSKSKQSNEDPSASYPTSAFSGKPVVGKTKIHTEGGKGSITIMRTKG